MEPVRGQEGTRIAQYKQALTLLKDKLRSSCTAKARAQRHDLLQRHRLTGDANPQQSEAALREQLQQLVRQEVADSSASVAALLARPPQQQEEDSAMTDHGPPVPLPPPPHAAYRASAGASMFVGSYLPRPPPVSDWDLEAEDHERQVHATLREFEDSLVGSLMAEELELLDRQQQAAAQEAGRLHEGDAVVLCPMCGRSNLVQQHGILACPHERWQLDMRAESLTLRDVRDRLAAAYEAHGQRGCSSTLQFRLDHLPGGCTVLAACCAACQVLQVVV